MANIFNAIIQPMETFSQWLQHQLDIRIWNQAKLAKRSGLSTAAISDLINHTPKLIKPETCRLIARAFKIKTEIVMAAAGYDVAVEKTVSKELQELNHMFERLSDNNQAIVLDIVQGIFDRQQQE